MAQAREDMQVSAEATGRPAPTPPLVDRARAWLGWFGVARLVASAVSMVVVCAGAFWLVRSPSPPAEAVLPRVSAAEVPEATLTAPSSLPAVSTHGGSGGSAGGADSAGSVLVHVAGAVAHPGVYRLDDGARIDEAIRVAGGPTDDADVDALNLAARVVDGMRAYVPVFGEIAPMLDPTGLDSATHASSGPVDINRADAALLDTLPGIGPATADAIVAERDLNGPFLGVEDLERVPGIGPSKLAVLRDLVSA